MKKILFLACLLVLMAVGCTQTPKTAGDNTYQVTVAAKDATHPYFGTGSTMGFVIGGVQGAGLHLKRGTTYTFQINTPGHPFYISTDPVGAGAGLYVPQGDIVLSDNKATMIEQGVIYFTPNANTPNQLYYQCGIHKNMGWKINIENP